MDNFIKLDVLPESMRKEALRTNAGRYLGKKGIYFVGTDKRRGRVVNGNLIIIVDKSKEYKQRLQQFNMINITCGSVK